jgi:drug/metabolite transporter (DMT)-like permease
MLDSLFPHGIIVIFLLQFLLVMLCFTIGGICGIHSARNNQTFWPTLGGLTAVGIIIAYLFYHVMMTLTNQ